MNKKEIIEKIIDECLLETTKLDFPFFANKAKKMEVISEKKKCVEDKLKLLDPNLFPNEETLVHIWEESTEFANGQFESLPDNMRINGFYLQELMHYYVEKLGNYIINGMKGN